MSSVALAPPPASAAEICSATLARHGKSFALASIGLTRAQRRDAAALYTWCRRADDAVDVGLEPTRALALEERKLDAIYAGSVQADPADADFQRVVFERGVPREYPEELLRGLAMDVAGTRYETRDDLYHYCHRVAGTVGLMMCHVLGVSSEAALRNAAHLGLAMQLTNICRDVHEDWQNGRLYLPRELLSEAGLAWLPERLGAPLPKSARAPLGAVVNTLLVQADGWYASAEQGLSALSFRASLSIRTASYVYAAIGHRLRARGSDVFAGRSVVPLPIKLALAARALGRSLLALPARTLHPHRPIPIHEVVRFPDGVIDV